jgi:hypothetical protein
MKKKAGRPPKGKEKMISVRVSLYPPIFEYYQRLALVESRTLSQTLRLALVAFATQHGDRKAALVPKSLFSVHPEDV